MLVKSRPFQYYLIQGFYQNLPKVRILLSAKVFFFENVPKPKNFLDKFSEFQENQISNPV
jgi:hypothetical protein